MKTTLLILALCLSVVGQTEYGKPSELKDLHKVFVDTGGDLKNRERITNEIEKAKLPVELLDSIEGAEIILNFGSQKETRMTGVNTGDNGMGGTRSTPVYRKIPTGTGQVLVVRGEHLRIVHSFEDEQTTAWERKPATNFGKEFVKAYKKANGIK
jgi:hypothetical protein